MKKHTKIYTKYLKITKTYKYIDIYTYIYIYICMCIHRETERAYTKTNERCIERVHTKTYKNIQKHTKNIQKHINTCKNI